MTNKTEAIEKIEEYLRFNTREGDFPCEEHQTWVKGKAKEIHAIYESLGYIQKAEDQSPPEFEGESYYSMFLLCLSSVFAQTIERITTPDRDGCVWIKAKKVNK